MRRLRVFAVFCLALSTCRFDDSVSADTRVLCTQPDSRECPSGFRCQTGISRCVAEADFDDTPPALLPGDRINIIPGPLNPRRTPTRLNASSEALVSFQVNEPLSGMPDLSSPTAVCRLDHAVSERDFSFRCTVSAPDIEASEVLTAVLVDRAGNRAEGQLSSRLFVDTRPPAPPDVVTPGRIVYTRVPWGAESTGGLPDFRVVGQAAAAEPGARVRFRSGAFDRGDALVTTAGAFTAPLVPLDAPDLDASTVDDAGNSSAWVAVADGRWVASFVGKEAGLATPNPHSFGSVVALGDAVAREDLFAQGAADGIDRVGGRQVTVWGGGRWEEVAALQAARPLGLVWDDARANALLFGELQGTVLGNTEVLLVWNGKAWRAPEVSDPEGDGNPRPLQGAVTVYDQLNRRMLRIGGALGSQATGEVWAWTGRSWRRLVDSPPLAFAGGFYQRSRRRVVVSGGVTGAGTRNGETLAFSDSRWTTLPPSLPPLAGFSVAYDGPRDEAWAFGGVWPDGGLSDTLYRFTGDAWQAVPTDGGPPPLTQPAFAWDEGRDVGVLTGGFLSQGNPTSVTWEWDRAQWRRVVDAGQPTLSGPVNSAVYDPLRREVVAVGNAGTTAIYSQGRWTFPAISTVRPEAVPPPRMACAASLGGCVAPDVPEVWFLSPTGWRQRFSQDLPVSRGRVVWDSARTQLLFVDNAYGYAWNPRTDAGWVAAPAATGWTGRLALTDAPGGPLLQQSNLVTRRWTPGGWVDGGSVAYARGSFDWMTAAPVDGGVLMVALNLGSSGGCGPGEPPESPAWMLDGGWTPANPPPSTLGALDFDGLRGRLLNFGGVNASLNANALLYESSEDGGWNLLSVGDPELDGSPPPRIQADLGYDPLQRRHVLLGGAAAWGAAPSFVDTWLLSLADERPGARVRLDLDAARLPATVTPVRLSAQAFAGGTGTGPDGGQVHGARWRTFRGVVWADDTVTPSAAPVGDAGLVEMRLEDVRALQRIIVGQRTLELELMPLGVNGATAAGLSVDYVEVSLDYRR
ncbi:MAG: hypothetical protein AB1938_26635 [Myxococcota bacterium]